jgi:hypothetical protein
VGVAASAGGLIVAEFIALTRLAHAMFAKSPVTTVRVTAVAFVVANLISLVNPDAVYYDLLPPSLVALWISQLIVFAVYPRFAARNTGLRASDVVLAVGASALMGYGLYAVMTTQLGT